MARPLILVKDGIAYAHRGKLLAPVSADDGYYYDVPEDWIKQARKGKSDPGVFESEGSRAGKIISCVAISEYPHLADDEGNIFTIGSISEKFTIGDTVQVGR